MGALEVVIRGAFRQLTCPKGEVATRIEIATQTSVDAWLESTFKTYPAQEVAAENLVRSFSFIRHILAWLMGGMHGTDEADERHERGGEREEVAASRHEGSAVEVQGEGAGSLSRIDVGYLYH
jgi:hypothetical protein